MRVFYLHTRLRLVSRKLSLRDLRERRGGGGARVLKQFIDLYTERVARGFVRLYVAPLRRHATYVVARAREKEKGRKGSFAVPNAPNSRREDEEERSALSVDSRHFTIQSIAQLVSVLNYTRFASRNLVSQFSRIIRTLKRRGISFYFHFLVELQRMK